jgi:hypothetical protein
MAESGPDTLGPGPTTAGTHLELEDGMPRKIKKSQLDAAIAELDRVRGEWLKRPGVTAVDVGYRITEDKLTDELAIRVHVRRKLPREALSSWELFPERLGQFPVDVIEAEYGPQMAESGPDTLGPGPTTAGSELEPLQ